MVFSNALRRGPHGGITATTAATQGSAGAASVKTPNARPTPENESVFSSPFSYRGERHIRSRQRLRVYRCASPGHPEGCEDLTPLPRRPDPRHLEESALSPGFIV